MSKYLVPRKINEVVKEANLEIDERRKGLKSKGIKTRWESLNALMGGGFQKGFNCAQAILSASLTGPFMLADSNALRKICARIVFLLGL